VKNEATPLASKGRVTSKGSLGRRNPPQKRQPPVANH